MLAEEIKLSREIIDRALKEAFRPMAAFSGGKDSLVLLHLLRTAGGDQIPVPVLNIDTGVKFEEIYRFIDKMQRLWGFALVRESNRGAVDPGDIARDKVHCCYQLKTVPLHRAIERYGVSHLLTAVRRDEHPARAGEEYFSSRANHIRVQPLLHFTREDIWAYIHQHHLPYCSLYDRGYVSLGCRPCTRPVDSGAAERSGRAPDKEQFMPDLRRLGYF
ncbi:phosphoadenosine phosphosulfate reductase family protein [Desulfofundulus thermobenzoicus]|uniref:Phosphoadenosine phosphosulfate reductase family protein n=1 Tax=Desulfofundulus thermobenzoicus TaxID=29376 RepID=A0A6N7IRV5_9FIRM|nr:phosphoadenosine phosphosulfate reductase family protein [Desulfofundulus thermobenzoicus]MQL52651.1 phosphoadenosine phosphosulfate reductase family protein [Desulfofundulus thermobenzoicus]